MRWPDIFARLLTPPRLTRWRAGVALGVALIADGLQLALGPLGWAFIDQAIDVVTMIIMSLLVGFHPLLLPTFVVELIPVVSMLPTWIGCTSAVVALRYRSQRNTPPPPANS
jgi:hypothetical protein